MYLFQNPVLERELLVNLRTARAFILLFCYNALLGLVVLLAWPHERQLDLTRNPQEATRLVGLFFLSQYVLASLLAPTFAAGAITSEKERKTYEMLLASPLRPGAIVLGKLLASLVPLGILIFSSLPIVVLALPLGGVSIYEVLAAYAGLGLSLVTFGMISIACSSFFQRTAAALVVSYLLVLPLALAGAMLWSALGTGTADRVRLLLSVTVLPGICAAVCLVLFQATSRRLLYPPDVGVEGNEPVDIDQEAREAVGMVIRRDQFPDRLFAAGQADGASARRRQSGLRQGNAERDFRAGHIDAARGDSSQHVSGDSDHGDVPVLAAGVGGVVHRLRGAVQLASRAGVFGRRDHRGARAADAGAVAHHNYLTMANSVGQIACGVACFQRADAVFVVAVGAGGTAIGLLLGEPAVDGGVCGDCAGVLRDDDHDRLVLLGHVPQNGAEHDRGLFGDCDLILLAPGGALLRRHVFSAVRRDRSSALVGSDQPLRSGLCRAAYVWRPRFRRSSRRLAAVLFVSRLLNRAGRVPAGRDDLALQPALARGGVDGKR